MMNDSNARMNAFQAGQIDCINLTGDQTVQAESLGIHVENYVNNSNWYIQFNTKKIRQRLGQCKYPPCTWSCSGYTESV